ncbi:MAG: phage portal protein, partial [Chthonomonas sp.]|nr:phage portal protein [Chthonomonas sp.]
MDLIAGIGRIVNAFRQTNYTSGFARSSDFSLDPCTDPAYMNSAVMSLLNWTVNNAGSARLETWKRSAEADQDELVPNSDAAKAWRFGHPKRGRHLIESGMYLSLLIEGTSFLYPLRDRHKQIRGFQYLPHYDCQFEDSKPGEEDIVVYTPGNGYRYRIPVSQLIINTYGVDPSDLRKGFSPLKAAMQEVMTDQEAAQYARVVIRNFGVIGGLVSPPGEKEGGTGKITDHELKNIRRLFNDGITGENRGSLIFSGKPLKFQQITASVEQLALEKVRRIPEERISAVFNVPAVVLGLGAGLDKSTYNNVREAKRAAWTNYLIPMQDRVAEQWDRQLLPHLENDLDNLYLGWDRKHVEALREDE